MRSGRGGHRTSLLRISSAWRGSRRSPPSRKVRPGMRRGICGRGGTTTAGCCVSAGSSCPMCGCQVRSHDQEARRADAPGEGSTLGALGTPCRGCARVDVRRGRRRGADRHAHGGGASRCSSLEVGEHGPAPVAGIPLPDAMVEQLRASASVEPLLVDDHGFPVGGRQARKQPLAEDRPVPCCCATGTAGAGTATCASGCTCTTCGPGAGVGATRSRTWLRWRACIIRC